MLEDAGAQLRVALDLGPLVVVERAGLVQDRVGDAELADVVEDAGGAHALDLVGREAELARDLLRVEADGLEWRAVATSRRSSVSASSMAAASCSAPPSSASRSASSISSVCAWCTTQRSRPSRLAA